MSHSDKCQAGFGLSDGAAGAAALERGAGVVAIVGGRTCDAPASRPFTKHDADPAGMAGVGVAEPEESTVPTPDTEPLLRIACEHCFERGCITCHGEGSVDALSPAHQFLAGWRGVKIDPADSDGQMHVWIVNRDGKPSKGLILDEDELRALIRAGSDYFDRVDQAAR